MNNSIKPFYDVIISGAGPCGITMANMLGMHNISTLIIDREADILMLPRAVGMCDEGSRILDSAGVFEAENIDMKEISKIFFDNKNSESVFHYDTRKKINGYSMQRTFHQPALERSLRHALLRFECIQLATSTELIAFDDGEDGITVRLNRGDEQLSVAARYLVAADGASSPIRKQLGIAFDGATYTQDWLIIDIANNPVISDDVHFSIDPARPGITLPLPGGRRRWEFVVKEGDTEESLYSDEVLERLLSPWGDFREMEIERKAIYSFHARTALRYRQGNVFLAGDAAHITPPFAGQGMMAGLRDAYNLSWKLAAVVNRQVRPEILDSYDAERHPHSRQIINFAKAIGSIVLPQSRIKVWLRNTFIWLATLVGFYSKENGARMSKIPNHINGGLLRHLFISVFKGTGVWFPQHKLTYRGDTRRSDASMDPTFYVVGWNNNPEGALDETTRARWQRLGGKFLTIGDDESAGTHFDTDGEFASYFRKKTIAVLRPDRVVTVRCKETNLIKQLNHYLNEISIAGENVPPLQGSLSETH
ncbi:MAG: FAD-dependent monooxygenase [Halioglobus sp.]